MKKTLIAAALSLGLLSASCLGPNKTFHSLHDWNNEFSENRWANEAVHLGLWIVPAYQISLLVDIIVVNSIEWWDN